MSPENERVIDDLLSGLDAPFLPINLGNVNEYGCASAVSPSKSAPLRKIPGGAIPNHRIGQHYGGMSREEAREQLGHLRMDSAARPLTPDEVLKEFYGVVEEFQKRYLKGTISPDEAIEEMRQHSLKYIINLDLCDK